MQSASTPPNALARAVRSALILSAAGMAGVAMGAEPSETELQPVVVVGETPVPGPGIDADLAVATVQTADATDIERAHAADLTAFMNRTLGSVYVNEVQNNPLQPDVNYRGYTASPLLGTAQGLSVYLDGVRLNQPFGDVVSWDLIPRQAISSIALMPGSNPLFGLNTLGGALAIRTKDGFTDPGLALELNYGSYDRRAVTAEWGGNTARGLYWYATANRFEEDGWRQDSPTEATQAFGKFGWRDERTDVALSFAYAETDLTGNGLQEQQFLARDYSSVYTKPDNTRNESWLVNLTGSHRVNEVLQLSANAYFRDVLTHTLNGDINDESLGQSLYQPSAGERAALAAAGYTGFPLAGETQGNTPFPSWRCIANILTNEEPNEKCNGLNNRTRTGQHDGGLSAQAIFTTPIGTRDNRFTVGVAQSRSSVRFQQSSQFGYLTPDRGVVTVEGPGAFADGTQDSEETFDARVDLTGSSETRSIFFSDTLALTSALRMTVSGRYDYTRIESVDAITPFGQPGSLTATHRFRHFNPALGFTFSPTEAWTAYLGVNEGTRAPSAIELGCADPENPCKLPNAMAGDPPLDQVRTRTWETGVRGNLGDVLAWNAGVFRADNRDDILFVADDQSGFGYFRNFGETRRQGFELGLTGRAGRVTVSANYTYLDATFRSEEEVGGEGNSTNEEGLGFEGSIDVAPGDHIPLIPHHIFKLGVGVDLLPALTLSADLVSIGGSYARGNENNQHEPDGVYYLGAGRSGGYTVVNLGTEFRPSDRLTVFAQLNNVLDRKYATGAQLGSTGFDANGNFVARPFAGPVIDGERPVTGSTFYAVGAPRTYWLGVRYAFLTGSGS